MLVYCKEDRKFVIYLLSHIAPDAVFPIFFPSEVVIKGAVRPNNWT